MGTLPTGMVSPPHPYPLGMYFKIQNSLLDHKLQDDHSGITILACWDEGDTLNTQVQRGKGNCQGPQSLWIWWIWGWSHLGLS